MADTTPTVSLLSRLTRARPRPLALEQRFVFDGAGAGDAVDAAATPAPVEPADQSADAPIKVEVAQNAPAERQGTTAERSNLFQSGGSHPTVNEAAATAADQIRQFLAQASDEQLFELFNGGQTTPSEQWTAELAHLRTSIADGTLEIGVRLLDNAQIKGALAAYAPEGLGGAPTILLNRDWLGVLNTEQVSRLLVEEYGHHLDHILNQGIDTAGDEGQRFAAAITGQDTGTPGFAADDDHATLRLDGESIDVEFATLTFSNAYKVNTATTPAGKESNSHDFVFSSLGQVSITDASNSRFFSGNDVSATALAIGTDVYYGWISRPIKSGGVVRGFYFWTDTDFNSLAAAQADGNQDGDSNVADNRGFLLVLDQAWFDAQAWKNQAANIKNVGSSSDRVDAALNSFVGAPVTPAATADVANGTPGTAGGAAVEAGGVGNATAGSAATGNVLSNDTGGDGKRVIAAGTTSASQSVTAATTSADGVPVTGLYGTLTLGADGSYRYVVNDANPQVQALRVASDTLVDTFTYRMTDASGATSTTTLSVTIQGANDAPVASNDYNTAKESIAGSGQYGASDTSGSLAVGNVLNNDTDVDRGDTKTVVTTTISGLASAITDGSSTTTVNLTASTGAISANDYVFLKNSNGSLTALRDGAGDVVRVSKVVSSQIYLSDSAAVSALPGGSTLLFANKPDGTGAAKTATLQSVTTTITASASLVISSSSGSIAEGMTVTGNGIESGTLISSVKYDSAWKIVGVTLNKNVALSATTELAFSNSATVGTNLTGQYGTLELIADGKYTYIPNSNNQALNEGQSAVEQFQYTMRDASGATSSATLFITVLGSGTNDPNAVNDTGTATEAGGTANGIVDTNPSGNLLANDTNGANVVVSGRPASTSTIATIGTNTQLVGLYGTLTLSSDGSYTYMVDNSNASVQALRDISTTLSDTFIYSVENGQTANGVRLQDSATLTITVRGANDAPVAADTVATAIEAGGVNNGTAGYNPSGNVLDVVTDVDDASSELRVTAVRLGGIEGSGNAGTVGSALTGLYGSLMLNADGSWTYTVDNNNAIVQALNPGQTLTERFNYSVTDRSGTGLTDIAVLTITIDGAADTVAVNSVFVNEASPYAVFTVSGSAGVAVRLELGTASLPSTDTLAALSGAGADIANSLEYFNGSNWQLYVANSSVIIPTGDKLLVRVAVNQDDVHEGNESFTLTATVSQGNSSTGIGTINDEGGEEGEGDIYLPGNTSGTPDSGGTLDDDRPTLSVTSPQVNEGAYAEFVVSLDKRSTQPVSFSPVLASDTANIGVDTGTTAQIERFDGNNWITVNGPVSIAAGELSVRLRIATVDDSFVEPSEMFSLVTGAISGTVTNLGGAAGIATIIDNDTQAPNNRAPVAVNDSLTATEDTPVNYSAAQLLGNDSDPDNDTISIASVTRGTGGDVALNSDGSVSFTPDPDFNGTATFTYTVTDGTLVSSSATVTISVAAVNDAAVISGIGTGVVTEDLNVTAGNLTTGGSLTVTDPDAGQASFQGTVTPSAGALGSLTIAPNGTWSYSVPNGAVQYLKAGETKVETFTVRSLDGTEHAVSVTINGVNDAAVISGIGTGAVTEDLNVTAGNLTTGGSLTVTDSDAGQASFQSTVTPSAGALGSLTIAPNGTWSYSVPNSAVQYLKAGETKVETFTVRSLDGTAHTVTVTINGVNDPALFAPGGQQGNVQEDTLLRSDGQISVTDADQGEAMIVAQPATRGQYGEFSIDSAGRWRYALDNANPAVQALGTADRRAETFTVTARDGTTTTVTITVQGLDESAVPQPQPQPQPVPRPVPPVVVAPPQPAAPLPVPIPAAPEPVAPPVQPVAFDTTIAPSNTLAAPAPVAAPLIAAVQSRDLDLGLHSRAPFVDIYTQRAGFQIVVIEAPQARLSLYHGVSDQYADAGAQTSFSVPYDAFAHTDPNERILLSATQANGQPLPGWVRFDPQSGKFELNTPANYRGELTIKILARDSQGREASSLFRFNVGDRKTSDATGRTTLSDQLRQVAAQRPVQALERALSTSRPVAEPAQPEGSPNETLPGNKAG